MADVTTLENIFKMITPADLLGAQKLNVATKIDVNILKELLDALYNAGSSGALSVDDLSAKLVEISGKATGEAAEQFKRVIHLYKTGQPCPALSISQNMAQGDDGKTPITQVTWDQVVGTSIALESASPPKTMGVIMCNSGYLSPMVRNAERVEMFMNFIPSVIASRLTPLLEVEFSFNRGVPNPAESAPHQWSPGMMRFLLGGDQSAASDPTSPTAKMLAMRETQDQARGTVQSIAGMEMFTSPQTLVNPSAAANASRYVDVLDPFRPLMSIESFNVNVSPTVGLYSYKKATLVFKLHDRSRLAEIGDIIRPQVYQDAGTAPTVWITYGWRHPAEPGNPYADFINGNMLVREAYGIINSQFSFDAVGQVQITMQLWTKGIPELRTLKINDSADGSVKIFKEIQAIAADVAKYRNALGIGPSEGVSKEVRGFMLIESAERGTFPDMSGDEIKTALAGLKKSLTAKDAKLDQDAANKLIAALGKFYQGADKDNLDFKKQLERQATTLTNNHFKEVMVGADPFLPFAAKDAKKSSEMKSEPHPFSNMVEALNAYVGETEVKTMNSPAGGAPRGFTKKAASFGKLVSVFTANTFKMMDGVDEMQLFFYQFNDQAGAAAGANIAEFPIDMPVFLDQYREHVERKGSERLTLEEFLRLAIDAQLGDSRAIGYGFRSFFAPYDRANKQDAKLKDGTEQAYENALSGIGAQRGPFRMPSIEMFVETVYASKTTGDIDLLHQFEVAAQLSGIPNGGRAEHYTRIMRIHLFDRANCPYKLAGTILRGDTTSDASFVEIDSAFLKQQVSDKKKEATEVWSQVMKSVLTPDGQLDRTSALGTAFSNQDIKNFVAKMVPTIVYGGNASVVANANLSSKQDPLLATTQMQGIAKKAGKPSILQPNGAGGGGLPLRVIPASMTMTTLGCPLLSFAQLFFIDFNTGTTIDNIYGLTGITHSIMPGKFESALTLTFYDAYGKYEAAPTVTNYIKQMKIP